MDAKTSDWRPGPTVCRCCLNEGCYKDISTEYFWMGKREVYAEMLSDTLNVSIAYSQSGGPNSNSRLICEPCISRLRDASDFRRQVQECEKTFMQHLDPGSSSVQKELQLTLEEVKIERVKQEKKISDDEDDFDDRVNFVVEDDDDDDLDDEPLMKLATKIPKKEVDLLELLDTSQITVKRKATAKAKEPPAKKTKKREIVIKPSASKPSVSAIKTTEKKKKGTNIHDDFESKRNRRKINYDDERNNALIILNYSNVCPFKYLQGVFVCCCCDFSSADIGPLREHLEKHLNLTETIRLARGYIVKADITGLRCEICLENFEDLSSFVEHLIDIHSIPLQKIYGPGIMSFLLHNEGVYKCAHCGLAFHSFINLNCHMNIHYPNSICSQCGKSFADTMRLRSHVFKRHTRKLSQKNGKQLHSLTLVNDKEKGDEFLTTRQDERDNAHIILKYSNICPFRYIQHFFVCCCCDFSSAEFGQLREHLEKHPNITDTIKLFYGYILKADVTGLRCKICHEELEDIPTLVDHLIEIHNKPLEKKYGPGIMSFVLEGEGDYKCAHCELTFKSFLQLNCHMNVHYPNTVCSECGRSYADIARLKSHIFKKHGNTKKVNQPRIRAISKKDNIGSVRKHSQVTKTCRFCNKAFPSASETLQHMKKVHSIREYQCSICPAVFKRAIKRTMHFRAFHMREKPFACDDCPYRCVTKSKLVTHMRTHTGETAFQCEECGKTYTDPKYRAKHMRIHLKERFNHMKKYAEESSFQCEECGKTYSDSTYRAKHMRLHLKERFTCGICSKAFFNIGGLTEHLKSHDSDVSYDDISISSAEYLVVE